MFFWGSDLFDELGRFEGLGDEMRIVVRESLTAYPAAQLKAAITATAQQLVRVATGYGVHTDIWHTHWIIETFAPHATAGDEGRAPAARRARLHRDQPPACAGRLGIDAAAPRRDRARRAATRNIADLGDLAAVVALAILANAAVCGALSNPHDRYGARMVWLATLVVLLVPWMRRSASTSGDARAG